MFSRWLEAEPVVAATAAASKDFFIRAIEQRWGLPRLVQVDRGSHFQGVFPPYLAENNVGLHLTHAWAPYSNGRGERQHKTLGERLRALITENNRTDWDTLVALAAHQVRTASNRGLGGYSSYEVVTGRRHSSPIDLLLPRVYKSLKPAAWANLVSAVQEHASLLSLLAAVGEKAGRQRRLPPATTFSVGDHVLVFFPTRLSKLHSYWRGPYKIVSVDAIEFHYNVALLELNGSFGDPISVHARRLLRYNFTRSSASIEAARALPAGELIVEGIVSHRDDGHGRLEFEVRWLGFTSTDFLYPSELTRLQLFKDYVAKHRLASRMSRQAAAERAARRAAAAPTTSDTTPAPPQQTGGTT